jgi:hypothetical protein
MIDLPRHAGAVDHAISANLLSLDRQSPDCATGDGRGRYLATGSVVMVKAG